MRANKKIFVVGPRWTVLCFRFAPSSEWYIDTINSVFVEAGDLARPEAIQNLLRLLAEGTGEDEEVDIRLRRYAVNAYLRLCDHSMLGDTLTKVISWVLGEFAYLEEDISLEDVAAHLCDLIDRSCAQRDTKPWIVNALIKLVAQMGECSEQVNIQLRV
jgi:AP-4 complex subunit epsilon-1